MIDPMEETYRDVSPYIWATIKSFLEHHSLSWDDARSVANLKFCEAYQDYDPNRGTAFSSWVVTRVFYGMLEDLRSMIQSNKKLSKDFDQDALDTLMENNYGQGLTKFLERIENRKNQKYVISLVFDPPQEVLQRLESWGSFSGSNYRIAIRQYLHKDKGWSLEKIGKVFDNIKAKL